tara:strand:- start:432 stop:764 length:333 start_codon:yes stop_codon:yes gene_type:complete
MPLSRKQLIEVKNKLKEKDQNAISRIRNAKGPATKQIKTTIKKEGFEQKKSVVRWNYKVNDLVRVTYGNGSIGLIISNFEYFSKRVEKNCFFVLIDNAVKQIDGRYIRQI